MIIEQSELRLASTLGLVHDRVRVTTYRPVRQAHRGFSPLLVHSSLQLLAHLLVVAERAREHGKVPRGVRTSSPTPYKTISPVSYELETGWLAAEFLGSH